MDNKKNLNEYKKILEQHIKISESIQNTMINFNSINTSLPRLASSSNFNYLNLDLPKFNYTDNITSAVQNFQKKYSHIFESTLINSSQIEFPNLNSLIKKISQPVFNFQAIIAPIQENLAPILESLQSINFNLSQTLQSPLLEFAKTAQSLVDSIDFSVLLYRKKWNKQRETLLEFEWFYSDELPDELVSHIHDNKENLNSEEVDRLIITHFRKNKCMELKRIVKSWVHLPCFKFRSKVFHEALVNHSRRYYNSSVTLLTVHTEGVITDFVRMSINNPRFKVEKALEDIRKEIIESEKITLNQYEVFNDVITQIELAFCENFEHSNPDAASNKSRHKIAHGHVYEAENEVNSLKRFLYLNEIYYLFCLLAEQKIE